MPDKTTILRLRRPQETHELTCTLFHLVRTLLEEHTLLLKAGTTVDATIIAAPSSSKNATKTRHPEMKQTRRGNQWYSGMKIHIGTDIRSHAHSLTTTDAAADIEQLDTLLHGNETTLHGDRHSGKNRIATGGPGVGSLSRHSAWRRTDRWDAINRARSKGRARCKHVLLVVKCSCGFTQVRYRGLTKNTARAYAASALADLYFVRHNLVLPGT